MTKTLTLVSREKDEVIVCRTAALLASDRLQLMEAVCAPCTKHLLNVDTETLQAVVNFMEQLRKLPIELNTDITSIPKEVFLTFDLLVPQAWYRDFCGNMDAQQFRRVQNAAIYLEINKLVELTSIWLTFRMFDSRPLGSTLGYMNVPVLAPAEGYNSYSSLGTSEADEDMEDCS